MAVFFSDTCDQCLRFECLSAEPKEIPRYFNDMTEISQRVEL